jgi:DNA polymerase
MEIKSSKIIDFENLLSAVKNCKKCERMCNRKKVLSKNNGNINSKVMFIAEAPGRLGAEQTGKPLYGDRTGDNFERLLQEIGWQRKDIFITNAILCNPQEINGNNSTPTAKEIANCSDYLKETIEIVNPDVIVTLGSKALSALKKIKRHNFVLKNDVAKIQSGNEKHLFPLYHPSPTSININRNMKKQISDYKKLSSLVDPISGLKKGKENTIRR